MKVIIYYEDNFKVWRRFTEKHHLPSAVKTAQLRAKTTKKRHKLVSNDGVMLDLIYP